MTTLPDVSVPAVEFGEVFKYLPIDLAYAEQRSIVAKVPLSIVHVDDDTHTGIYDTVSYAWSIVQSTLTYRARVQDARGNYMAADRTVSSGSFSNATSQNPEYRFTSPSDSTVNSPPVDEPRFKWLLPITIRCVVAFRGTGTNAKTGSVKTVTKEFTFRQVGKRHLEDIESLPNYLNDIPWYRGPYQPARPDPSSYSSESARYTQYFSGAVKHRIPDTSNFYKSEHQNNQRYEILGRTKGKTGKGVTLYVLRRVGCPSFHGGDVSSYGGISTVLVNGRDDRAQVKWSSTENDLDYEWPQSDTGKIQVTVTRVFHSLLKIELSALPSQYQDQRISLEMTISDPRYSKTNGVPNQGDQQFNTIVQMLGPMPDRTYDRLFAFPFGGGQPPTLYDAKQDPVFQPVVIPAATYAYTYEARPDALKAITVVFGGVQGLQEEQTLSPTVTVTGGIYDTVTYAWSVEDSAAGAITSPSSATPTFTAAALVVVGGVVQSRRTRFVLTLTYTGTGTNAARGTTATETVKSNYFSIATKLPQAVAPTVAISGISNVKEELTLRLRLSVSGGTYDDLDYQWSVTPSSAGTFNSSTRRNPVFTANSVSSDIAAQVSCEVLAKGTGTVARDDTTAMVTATSDLFAIQDGLPVAAISASSITIEVPDTVVGGQAITVSGEVSGRDLVYDTITYAWVVTPSGAGTFADASAESTTFTAAARTETQGDLSVTIIFSVSVSGDGITAENNSNANARQTAPLTIRWDRPDATAPTIELQEELLLVEKQKVTLEPTIVPEQGAWDTIAYAWAMSPTTLGTFTNANIRNAEFTATDEVTRGLVQLNGRFELTITVTGTGGRAVNGTSATTTASLSVTISNLDLENDVVRGVWKETVAPGVRYQLDPNTMPLVMEHRKDDPTDWQALPGVVGKLEDVISPDDPTFRWLNRIAGDLDTVPDPGFIDKQIKDLAFFQNRLIFLTENSIVASFALVPGLFWGASAQQTIASDPIDIDLGTDTPAKDMERLLDSLVVVAAHEQHRVYAPQNDTGWQPGAVRADHIGSAFVESDIGLDLLGPDLVTIGANGLLLSLPAVQDNLELRAVNLSDRIFDKISAEPLDFAAVRAAQSLCVTNGKRIICCKVNYGENVSVSCSEHELAGDTTIEALASFGEHLVILCLNEGDLLLESLYLGNRYMEQYGADEGQGMSYPCLDHSSVSGAGQAEVELSTGETLMGDPFESFVQFAPPFLYENTVEGAAPTVTRHFSLATWEVYHSHTSYMCAANKPKGPNRPEKQDIYNTNELGSGNSISQPIEDGQWRLSLDGVPSQQLNLKIESKDPLGFELQAVEWEGEVSDRGRPT